MALHDESGLVKGVVFQKTTRGSLRRKRSVPGPSKRPSTQFLEGRSGAFRNLGAGKGATSPLVSGRYAGVNGPQE